jgi:TonB family protein
VGHGLSGGNSWSLSGRGIKGTLPQPANTFNQEGRVIIEIRVNAAGNIVSAVVKGGNISDKQTQQLALEAARKAKFTEGDHDQIGTITYNFKFN